MPTTKRVQRGHTIVALCALAVALFGVTTFITSELASDERAIAKQPSVRSPTQMSPLVESAACPSETTEPVSSASATATTTAVAPSSSTVDTRANVVPVPAKRKAMRRANERKKEGTIRVDDTSKKRHLGYVDRDD